MSNYVIGDVQGCFDSLQALLREVVYNPEQDTLWFAGDLVNRGPRSLDTLRFIRQLGHKARVVLGNHDLHLLALYAGHGRQHRSDTIADIVQAPDACELIDWLRAQPLVQALPGGHVLVHAGILPQWSHAQALAYSAEVQAALQADDWVGFMTVLYGNQPDHWSDSLSGHDRLRLIVNVCTRMRMLREDGSADFKFKLEPADAPAGLKPWFDYPRAHPDSGQILFGHWSTLPTLRNAAGYCLDTGCVWGGQLTALRLEDFAVFQVPAQEPGVPIEP